jgi:hypothetical protein
MNKLKDFKAKIFKIWFVLPFSGESSSPSSSKCAEEEDEMKR